MTRKSIIKKSPKHGHWMVYHCTGYSSAHNSFTGAVNAASAELRRYGMARSEVWVKVDSELRPSIGRSYHPPMAMAGKKAGQTLRMRDRIKPRDGPRCHYCNKVGKTLDHIVPKSKHGPNVMGNIVLACSPCNSEKSDNWSGCMCDRCGEAWRTWGMTLF